ncbi:tetratricopeptide repeat protein [Polynucleobacter sp. AP-Sving-400A-A2]|uniref:tetratricopeptide repeat protein n=1 Tax=Polynucleobacter sp. AP-Sving-400A-A2 TaxID=2081049 RepID=UPI001BFDC08C|nr:tetratricopeptide repeat protein [Polynucleobacter sp. AP-Sving-400A-A2]QWE13693.1 tetratricopeptide repeat protein [Polynucleobacter sp. AP-Sving-400A-A2]
MSPFFTPNPMSANHISLRPAQLGRLYAIFAVLLLVGCSTPGQQLAEAEIKALNSAPAGTQGTQAPYLGSYGPNDPPRLAGNEASYDQFNAELSDSVAVPFLSFLIIEPDPVTKNGVPSDIEKLVKAKKYPEAIDSINKQLKKTPGNVQLRYVKARMQIEMRQWAEAKKTLVEITQQFPELPEPYNNLAALAANQGNWIEARDYLELALKLRPSYTVASANLGEVYIRLATQAYDNAAKDAALNQRQYTNRAKALMEILKPPKKLTAPMAPAPK